MIMPIFIIITNATTFMPAGSDYMFLNIKAGFASFPFLSKAYLACLASLTQVFCPYSKDKSPLTQVQESTSIISMQETKREFIHIIQLCKLIIN